VQDWKRPSTVVYGVFEIPRYMDQERSVESVWATERAAADRALARSIRVHGRVRVVSWEIDAPDTGRVLHEFTDGSPAQPPRSRRG